MPDKKPNIVEIPEGVADEFIATGHAKEAGAAKGGARRGTAAGRAP